jgi:hypothetical protein
MRLGALWHHDLSINSRTRQAGTLDRSRRRPMNVFPLRQISSYAFGCSAAAALASLTARLTVMVAPPFSTPTKLFPATLKEAIRRAAGTGGPSFTSGKFIAMARSSLSPINLNNSFRRFDFTLARWATCPELFPGPSCFALCRPVSSAFLSLNAVLRKLREALRLAVSDDRDFGGF